MEDICNFIPVEIKNTGIEYFHFVYETNLKRLKQPLRHNNFYAHIVFKGTALLKAGDREYPLIPGTLFFTFPFQPFEIVEDTNFTFLYISFNGGDAEERLSRFGIGKDRFVFSGFEQLTDFWMNAIRRVNTRNAVTLTESVLLYTLSFIPGDDTTDINEQNGDRLAEILAYVNNTYTDPDITLSRIADMFFYSEKYLSALFVRRTGKKFTEYLNHLRIQHAIKLMKSNSTVISEIAVQCGFKDPAYFSKVFKRTIALTPQDYIKQNSTLIG